MRSTADHDFDLEFAYLGKQLRMAPAVNNDGEMEESVL